MKQIYYANGFTITSDILLLGWRRIDCDLDYKFSIRIHLYHAKFNTQYKKETWPYIYVDRRGLIFNWDNRIAMRIIDGKNPICVQYQMEDSVKKIEVTFALNFILSYIAHKHNRIALHGCCFADKQNRATIILGESGCGKSTFLYKVLMKGYKFISEEVCFVNIGESIETFSSNQVIRLNADMYSKSEEDILYDSSDSKITFWNAKYETEISSILLDNIVFLEKSETKDRRLEELCISEALNLILKKYLYTKSVIKKIPLGDVCESIIKVLRGANIYKYKGYPSCKIILQSLNL